MHHSYIDRFANQASPVHGIDARAKLLAVVAYTVLLISVPKYHPLWALAFAPVPLLWLWVGRIPPGFVGKHILVVSPFVVCLAAFNPIWDAAPKPLLGAMVRGGVLVSASIVVKFVLGMGVLIGLSSTTRFADLLVAMQKLGVPRMLVTQLSFLYRYLFVLIDQAMHIQRARDARLGGFAPVGVRLRAVGGIVGSLFIRTLEQAERTYQAMMARGYDGTVRTLVGSRLGARDAAFLTAVVVYAVVCRWLPAIGGSW